MARCSRDDVLQHGAQIPPTTVIDVWHTAESLFPTVNNHPYRAILSAGWYVAPVVHSPWSELTLLLGISMRTRHGKPTTCRNHSIPHFHGLMS